MVHSGNSLIHQQIPMLYICVQRTEISDAVKNMLRINQTERWNKETSGVTVTISGTEYSFPTDRESRSVLQMDIHRIQSVANFIVRLGLP